MPFSQSCPFILRGELFGRSAEFAAARKRRRSGEAMAPKKAEKGKAKAEKGEKAEKTAKAVKGTVSKKVTRIG